MNCQKKDTLKSNMKHYVLKISLKNYGYKTHIIYRDSCTWQYMSNV